MKELKKNKGVKLKTLKILPNYSIVIDQEKYLFIWVILLPFDDFQILVLPDSKISPAGQAGAGPSYATDKMQRKSSDARTFLVTNVKLQEAFAQNLNRI